MIDKLIFWFKASRGYSLPMSIFSWLVVFSWCFKDSENIFYGILALIGIVLAHAGTNLYDDYIDFKNEIPKQDCKRVYFKDGKVGLNKILLILSICFGVAFFIGIFFVLKFGINIILISVSSGILCLLYPKLNHYALGEFALILLFGPCLFYGISLVMGVDFEIILLLVSVLVGILTVILLDTHALMDFDSDKESKKRTLLIIFGSKKNALFFLFSLIFLSYVIMILLMLFKLISPLVLLIVFTLPMVRKLYGYLKEYIVHADSNNFLRNFVLARNLVVALEMILTVSILLR